MALAGEHNADLTFLHVVDVNARAELGSADLLMRHLWEKATAQMQQLVSSLDARFKTETAIEEGLPWDEIVERSRDYDLVVLSRGRPRRIWNPFSHHTVERVTERAACPVAVVTEQNSDLIHQSHRLHS
jgi:nucleotide-binding universal stress UspA family protein